MGTGGGKLLNLATMLATTTLACDMAMCADFGKPLLVASSPPTQASPMT
jgi:hypothetical protein